MPYVIKNSQGYVKNRRRWCSYTDNLQLARVFKFKGHAEMSNNYDEDESEIIEVEIVIKKDK
jgi:hypothetical protein